MQGNLTALHRILVDNALAGNCTVPCEQMCLSFFSIIVFSLSICVFVRNQFPQNHTTNSEFTFANMCMCVISFCLFRCKH